MSVETDRLVGTDLAGYRLESVLGRGGMGVVYLATDLRLERKVALKLVAPELAGDPRFRERFLRESRLAASLDHSHVVPVHAAGETDGQLWIAMRYVQGTDLKTLLDQEGPLEPARALELVAQVGEALDAAHAHGLVHRDVKPANVLVTEEGGEEHCYLADFGLARTADLEAGAGTGAHLSGTVDYTAPEQIAARDRRPARRRLLARLRPLRVPSRRSRPSSDPEPWPRCSRTPASRRPPSTSSGPSCPRRSTQSIARALAKDPDERYETCDELVRRGAARRSASASTRFTRRQLVLAGTGAALAVAAAAAVPAILLSRGEEATAPKPILPLADTSLVRVDPTARSSSRRSSWAARPSQVATGLGSVWIVDPRESALKELDPATSTLTRTIDLTHPPISIEVRR